MISMGSFLALGLEELSLLLPAYGGVKSILIVSMLQPEAMRMERMLDDAAQNPRKTIEFGAKT
jgi:hypothetical protein